MGANLSYSIENGTRTGGLTLQMNTDERFSSGIYLFLSVNMQKITRTFKIWTIIVLAVPCHTIAADRFVTFSKQSAATPVCLNGRPANIVIDQEEYKGVTIAARSLADDFMKVTGQKAELTAEADSGIQIVIGSADRSELIRQYIRKGLINGKLIKGKNEAYIITTFQSPKYGRKVVIAGSDQRGTIYGIYELSRQIGVSPWWWWADVPAEQHSDISILPGTFTDGEPAVRYRGIFLNDEAPCLTTWAAQTFGNPPGGHQFYEKVFELVLRLKGNFIWPAMWSWAFYEDDPLNSRTAQDMGIIVGTSHHEPMGRNHQEWARRRKQFGEWNYRTNKDTIQEFFRYGIERLKDTEDLVTIGMRGDGDAAMSDQTDVKLLEEIVSDQRNIIKKVTGKPAEKTPQVWALYKEVMQYYEAGMKVPDDVTMLLCDDNWGNICRVPNAKERKHPGGWGIYYHVDYVGAPRNSKWLNCTPPAHMWEQLDMAYKSGIDRIWILNVGDLKPMEYPITLFLDMAWNPERFSSDNLQQHAVAFCNEIFGQQMAEENARLLTQYARFNGRVTPEMLDCRTYNLDNGEWEQVCQEYTALEADALRAFNRTDNTRKDAFRQLILFPIQAMANLYRMYYAQAMNLKLAERNMPEANFWADKVEEAFKLDSALCREYNRDMSEGKWNGMMIQKHIGYKSWNDDFKRDMCPVTRRVEKDNGKGGFVFLPENGYAAIEAPHFFEAIGTEGTQWTFIKGIGRTMGGMALRPYSQSAEGAALKYRMKLPQGTDSVKVHVIVRSTLACFRPEGHRYKIGFENGNEKTVNFNYNLNEKPENVYTTYYPTVARRVIEKTVRLALPQADKEGWHTLIFSPVEPGTVLEKIVVDYGGYEPSYLFMTESPCKRL